MSEQASTNVLGISGSLRQESFNTRLLHASGALAPLGMNIDVYEDLAHIPPYNSDNDGENAPQAVENFRAQVRDADALLIATPEYNYSIPGVLKNAIDWLSTGDGGQLLAGKPIAVMGAAPTAFGSVRAQLALRQVFVWTDSKPVVKPEVIVFNAHERFDGDKLVDEGTQDLVRRLLQSLAAKVDEGR
ncbi:NADPH-dependent FMN reductase [Nocardioides sp. LS1]|uniref:NADPH-dependent FMN reductase n=1 Tax=Nocardioides sp. LS1 TaxID=1027620 RepID=UPI000F6228C1|nr:NADPH-dependent FMN reductase [Nocardioides sp. LS1]GCD88103.1 NAD(P)H-dependent FMN reductase [Nocardioides sp. LS1]